MVKHRRRAHLFGIGETKRRRRKRTSVFLNEKRWSGVDTVMTIGALGALAFVGYFVLKSGKGVEEGLQTGGDWLKSAVDAINSTGNWIGSGSKWLQDWSYGVQKGFGEAVGSTGETLGNIGCWTQKVFNPSLQCTDLNAQQKYVFVRVLAGGSPKPATKITNNVYHTMMRVGLNPELL